MQHVTHFLAKHLPEPEGVKDCKAVCRLCGEEIWRGVPFSKVVSSNFTDFAAFRFPSAFLCAPCSASLGRAVHPEKGDVALRNYSFLATEEDLHFLKREQVWQWMENPPEPPFVFGVTYAGKKHIAYRAQVATQKEDFVVTTETDRLRVFKSQWEEVSPVVQSWYTVIPEKATTQAQPTWFTKEEILTGRAGHWKVEAYGVEKFFTENAILEPFRGQSFLGLLVFAANKVNYVCTET